MKSMSKSRQVMIALDSPPEHEMLDPQAVKQALIQILDQGFVFGGAATLCLAIQAPVAILHR